MLPVFNKCVVVTASLLFLCVLGNASTTSLRIADTAINPPLITSSYNDSFYNSVIEAASCIAQPYLLQQNYYTMPGVTVSGSSLNYKGINYPVSESYFNPGTGYYIASSLYAQYGISNFKSIWPNQCPNAFYDSATHTFYSKIDCVGFGTRLLSVVGGTTTSTNAYLNLINRIKTNNVSNIAAKGFVATAYQFAVDFPTLKTAPKPGWAYISGNVCDINVIDGYNKVLRSGVGTYNGVRKGGFALCLPGDVLAFGYDSSSSSNGHFMILDKQPQLLDATTLQTYYPKATATKVKAFVKAHKVYAVSVIDDSGKDAHFNDSRTSYSGIGHGTVLIVADTADDAPVGFIFSPSTNISYTPVDTSHCYAISVGRFVSAAQLPVSLASFSGKVNNKTVLLNWESATEINVEKFEIERSTDGNNYSVVGSENAFGQGGNNYQFSDIAPPSGISYYRLRLIDKDGTLSYSKVIVIQLGSNTKPIVVYPNPTKDNLNVIGAEITRLEVFDNSGREVCNQFFNHATNPTLKVGSLTNGIYHLRIFTKKGKSILVDFMRE